MGERDKKNKSENMGESCLKIEWRETITRQRRRNEEFFSICNSKNFFADRTPTVESVINYYIENVDV